jgi:hypothetical protein
LYGQYHVSSAVLFDLSVSVTPGNASVMVLLARSIATLLMDTFASRLLHGSALLCCHDQSSAAGIIARYSDRHVIIGTGDFEVSIRR